ncbi:hypothetical protein CDAR_499201 [Caerostris darwini]|uniref:Uncharacterized protein n=1 Tax=Caerostris darwini TaxID=1538125 RepID=A0AAV4PE04_9ARAC|nr:hypothetical protein CDAR_499201 [Caerostris darwini]
MHPKLHCYHSQAPPEISFLFRLKSSYTGRSSARIVCVARTERRKQTRCPLFPRPYSVCRIATSTRSRDSPSSIEEGGRASRNRRGRRKREINLGLRGKPALFFFPPTQRQIMLVDFTMCV